jgi:hypothetical protein
MKKYILGLILAVCFFASQAQVSFGVKAGYNSNIYVTKVDYFVGPSTNESSNGNGYFLGAFVKLPLLKKFSITPELQFSKRGGAYFSDNYLELPVFATFSPFKVVDFDLGVTTGFFLSSDIRFKVNNSFDFGLSSGFRINLSKQFSLIGRYYLGITPARSITDFNLTFNGITLDPMTKSWDEYNRTIQFGSGYKIK